MTNCLCVECGHKWFSPEPTSCPECGEFVMIDYEPQVIEDGHFEGDFPRIPNAHEHGDE